MLLFSWVEGIISFCLVPLSIENLEFTPHVGLMLFQCLLTGAITGSVTYFTGRWGPGTIAGIFLGYGLGFFFVGQDDQPWGTIGALAMLLPLVFVGALTSLVAVVVRVQYWASVKKP